MMVAKPLIDNSLMVKSLIVKSQGETCQAIQQKQNNTSESFTNMCISSSAEEIHTAVTTFHQKDTVQANISATKLRDIEKFYQQNQYLLEEAQQTGYQQFRLGLGEEERCCNSYGCGIVRSLASYVSHFFSERQQGLTANRANKRQHAIYYQPRDVIINQPRATDYQGNVLDMPKIEAPSLSVSTVQKCRVAGFDLQQGQHILLDLFSDSTLTGFYMNDDLSDKLPNEFKVNTEKYATAMVKEKNDCVVICLSATSFTEDNKMNYLVMDQSYIDILRIALEFNQEDLALMQSLQTNETTSQASAE